MDKNSISKLTAISPIDGRYREKTKSLSPYFSEYGLMRERVKIEIEYLIFLSSKKLIRKITPKETETLIIIYKNFELKNAVRIKEIEKNTRHDVKAVEYFLREAFEKSSVKDLVEFIHFGLTSEDLNNICIRTLLQSGGKEILIPSVNLLQKDLNQKSKSYKNTVMMGRTHGQNAIPTTLGKEISVFEERLDLQISKLEKFIFFGKFGGAIGNFNALNFVHPNINWPKVSKEFIKSLSLSYLAKSTQVNGNDDIVEYFQIIERINLIILGLDQDIWRYISDGWIIQANKKDEVGSSTMPQKINPIDFENSEGNIALANGLIDVFVNKLPISRLQRDLSNSTVTRSFGSVFAYCLISYSSLQNGLSRISPNIEKITNYLNEDWSILSEAAQTLLRKEGSQNGYKLLAELTKGKAIKQKDWIKIVDKLPLSDVNKNRLAKLTPANYRGIY